MKGRIRVFGVVAAALFTLGIATATSASAIELPQFSVESGFKGESVTTTFETVKGSTITCKSSTVEGTATSKRLGLFHIHFKECVVGKGVISCTGLGEESGVILFLGTWHLASQDGVTFLLLLLEEVHLNCSALILVNVKGSLLEPITPVDSETTKFMLEPHESKGVEKFTQYENDAAEVISAALLASTNHAAFEELGEESKVSTLTTEKADRVIPVDFSFTGEGQSVSWPRPFGFARVRVISAILNYIKGSRFTVLNNCLLLERPPCEYRWQLAGPHTGTSESLFEVQYLFPDTTTVTGTFFLLA